VYFYVCAMRKRRLCSGWPRGIGKFPLSSDNGSVRIRQAGLGLAPSAEAGIVGHMADAEKEQPVMLPFADKAGTGWHVIVRYHEGHERRIDGFATEQEALDWIIANSGELNK
jgi:hypothetical protein